MKRLVIAFGTRPQIIKLAPLYHELVRHTDIDLTLVNSGQHYDPNMSSDLLYECGIPEPDYNLNIGGGSHAENTGKLLIEFEKVYLKERPDLIITFGDTDTTLAAALAGCKLQIPIAHIEAGLRSLNFGMPEEQNRILVDRISSILFCPNNQAVENLQAEGIKDRVYNVGDVMCDAFNLFKPPIVSHNDRCTRVVVTLHRPSTVDNEFLFRSILMQLNDLAQEYEVVFPIHPRIKDRLISYEEFTGNIVFTEPLTYKSMVALLCSASLVITDSGGLQKDAYFAKVGCMTLRTETEWTDLVEAGVNKLVPPNTDSLREYANSMIGLDFSAVDTSIYGTGQTAINIVQKIQGFLK